MRKSRQSSTAKNKQSLTKESLDSDAWSRFLQSQVEGEGQSRKFAGGPFASTTAVRAYHRWVVEQVCPTMFSADRFLTAHHLHIDDYFDFCERHGFNPWALGQAPPWLLEHERKKAALRETGERILGMKGPVARQANKTRA